MGACVQGRHAIHNDGDVFELLDVLARKVGILGVFSDRAGTVTYYANCMGTWSVDRAS
jgi:glycerophosphoryl diester phosphodiesterase